MHETHCKLDDDLKPRGRGEQRDRQSVDEAAEDEEKVEQEASRGEELSEGTESTLVNLGV